MTSPPSKRAQSEHILVIRAPNGDVRELPLDGVVVIGRDASADVRVEDKKVSRRHAAFRLIDGKPYVEDLGSSNGVKLDGVRIEKSARLDRRSEVRLGGYIVTLRPVDVDDEPTSALPLDALPGSALGTGPMVRSLPRSATPLLARSGAGEAEEVALIGLDPPVAGRRFALRPGENVLGRLDECDVAILDASVSRQHARIVVTKGRLTIHDLGSANGIEVEGRPASVAELAHRDRFRVGEVGFEVDWPSAVEDPRPIEARVTEPSPPASRLRWALVAGGVGVLAFASSLFGVAQSQGLVDLGSLAKDLADRVLPREEPDPLQVADVSEDEPSFRPGLPAGRPFGPVDTATSPWSARGPDDLPVDLPEVDPDFDHQGFVTARLEAAGIALEGGHRAEARAAIDALLEVDPIHEEARALRSRLAELEAADEALARADRAIAEGEVATAYAILSSVPVDLPQAAPARERAEALREEAVRDALVRAKREAGTASTWTKAHERYKLILSLQPGHRAALDGLRSLERKMRKRKMAFEAWMPPGVEALESDEARGESDRARLGKDGAPVVEQYLLGDAPGARREAERRSRRARGDERERLTHLARAIAEVERRFERVRREIANDPSQAWALLLDLEEVERRFVPAGARSYLVSELRADLSDAFAKEGEALFDTHRYEAAFQRWEAGYKLDPTNPRVVSGLDRLEEVSKRLAEEARVAARRGANADACGRFRQVTRLTRARADLHVEARRQALALCP